MTEAFSPGDLVYARGREWVTLPSPDEEMLCLRPLSGSEADVQFLHPALEREPVRPARFEMPDLKQLATQDGAWLLSQALHLSLRRGKILGSEAADPRTRYSRTINVAPRPGSLSTSIVPWCCSTMCLAMARPRPVPPLSSARLLSMR